MQEEEELRRLEEEAERAREDALRRKQEKKDRRCGLRLQLFDSLAASKIRCTQPRLPDLHGRALASRGQLPASVVLCLADSSVQHAVQQRRRRPIAEHGKHLDCSGSCQLHVRRAEMKKQGLLLTGKAKKEADRLAAVRETLLKNAGSGLAGEPCSCF